MGLLQSIRQKTPKHISYWIIPLLSGTAWLTTLTILLIYHYTYRRTRYPSMEPAQNVPFISDIGASTLKPLFITGSVLTTVLISLTLVLERYFRHSGRLTSNRTRLEKGLAGSSIGFAIIGTVGLVGLSIFDTWRFRQIHNLFLALFMIGFVFSSICSCWEYQRLGKHFREYRILRASFWLKLVFVMAEIALAIAFATFLSLRRSNIAAVLEWVVAYGFSFYIFSFIPDMLPAMYTRPTTDKREVDVEMNERLRDDSTTIERSAS